MTEVSHESRADSTVSCQHERTDISLRPIGLFAMGLVLMIGGVLLLLERVFWRFDNLAKLSETPQSHVVSDQVLRGPALQAQSKRDLIEFRRTEDHRLTSYAWVDRTRNMGRIPIEAAMRVLAERGFPEPTDQLKASAEQAANRRPGDGQSAEKRRSEKPLEGDAFDGKQEVPR